MRQTPKKQHVIVDLEFNDEEQAESTDGEGWLDALIALREELIQGDFRVLYLAWLKAAEGAVEMEEIAEDTLEPPVPAGLGQLSPALETFVRFLDIDADLLAVAAQQSEKRRQEHPQLEASITQLPGAEQHDFLVRLSRGEANLSLLLRRRLQELATETQPHEREAKTGRRTIAALREAATVWQQQQQAAEQRQAELARRRRLETLAAREPQVWQEIEALLEEKKASAYDSAVSLLQDLRDLATSRGDMADLQQRLADIERTYSNRSALLRRMRQSRLIRACAALARSAASVSHATERQHIGAGIETTSHNARPVVLPAPSTWDRERRRHSASGMRGLLHGGVDLCLGIERTV